MRDHYYAAEKLAGYRQAELEELAHKAALIQESRTAACPCAACVQQEAAARGTGWRRRLGVLIARLLGKR
ncbi:hypothetical protein [Paenibacillus radicis (ex Gao et al. 2016)]|uniref:Uncharacterized protein n=1 Tax=Paenibacillus radicis (ex Gao et al. 2016) TaxID=1737354 RepID=A0A917M4Y4_9BACL|nr:hypothetical protein [Paenibacillus radicis (ex Gao et al. 2016)]GGG79052.1 hypothetical protein GCM10010918_40080 [Paenibacillus radicis (ex Gao et al. 2016)]